MRIGVGAKLFPRLLQPCVAVGEQLLGTVYILLRHNAAWMLEAVVARMGKHFLGLIAQSGLRLGKCRLQIGNIFVDQGLRGAVGFQFHLCQTDGVLQFGQCPGSIAVGSRCQEGLAFLDGCAQGGEVAPGAIFVVVLHLAGH